MFKISSENIPEKIVSERFKLADGYCECCGKQLVKSRRGRDGQGSWEAHHRFPKREATIENVRIVCTAGVNCHLKCSHQGDYNNPPVWSPCNWK